jgi:shikimate dehydrogenase
MISGDTRLVGIIGWPVSHSRSPAMHNAAFAALELNWAYVPLPVPPERVGDAVRGLRALGFAGANVTVPHKQAVMPYLDELTATATAVGAVNTIVVREDGSLLGDTTDGYGFLADLAAHGARSDGRAVVIGAGGAARSVIFALAQAGAEVSVAARNLNKAEALCRSVIAALPWARASARGFPNDLPAIMQSAPRPDLIVNATNLGLHEGDALPWHPGARFESGQVAYDVVYNRETEFLRLAREQGARAIGGLGMLIHQGARAFELWTGVAAPVEVMRIAARG